MPRLLLSALACGLLLSGTASAGRGSFESSDPLLNTIWAQSVATARMMVSPAVDLAQGCEVTTGRPVILDGVVRDRCEFTGDIAVTGKTLYVADGATGSPVKGAILDFAARQQDDGIIQSTPGDPGANLLVDYTAYWIEDVYDYVLHSGDVALARALLPAVTRALDGWYARHMVGSLFANTRGLRDYGLPSRRDTFVAYYNAQHVRALTFAAEFARWAGNGTAATRWSNRAERLRPVVRGAFWNPVAGAFKDTLNGPLVHSQDGNAFAVLARVATRKQALSALAYLSAHNAYGYGNSSADNDAWDGPQWEIHWSRRVSPFMSYFELVARFETGLDDSAIELIRREWGYMVNNGPGTTWENIGPYGSGPFSGGAGGGSWAHGWSSGAAPALTSYVLGVRPTSPGYSTFVVDPHPGDLAWARGVVPTPYGDLEVSWTRGAGGVAVTVSAPAGAVWADRPAANGVGARPKARSRPAVAPTPATRGRIGP